MEYFNNLFLSQNLSDLLTTISTSYMLIFAAEIGDKSQLVCMVLAARYRPIPVLLGASLAFAGLNLLAVTFGLAIASWLPEVIIVIFVSLLFFVFGWHAINQTDDTDTSDEILIKKNNHLLLSTFFLIAIAEFGDKTQLAVVALSSAHPPLAVFIGATVALISTSALGVWAGRTVLKKFPLTLLHKISGIIFIILALYTWVNFFWL